MAHRAVKRVDLGELERLPLVKDKSTLPSFLVTPRRRTPHSRSGSHPHNPGSTPSNPICVGAQPPATPDDSTASHPPPQFHPNARTPTHANAPRRVLQTPSRAEREAHCSTSSRQPSHNEGDRVRRSSRSASRRASSRSTSSHTYAPSHDDGGGGGGSDIAPKVEPSSHAPQRWVIESILNRTGMYVCDLLVCVDVSLFLLHCTY